MTFKEIVRFILSVLTLVLCALIINRWLPNVVRRGISDKHGTVLFGAQLPTWKESPHNYKLTGGLGRESFYVLPTSNDPKNQQEVAHRKKRSTVIGRRDKREIKPCTITAAVPCSTLDNKPCSNCSNCSDTSKSKCRCIVLNQTIYFEDGTLIPKSGGKTQGICLPASIGAALLLTNNRPCTYRTGCRWVMHGVEVKGRPETISATSNTPSLLKGLNAIADSYQRSSSKPVAIVRFERICIQPHLYSMDQTTGDCTFQIACGGIQVGQLDPQADSIDTAQCICRNPYIVSIDGKACIPRNTFLSYYKLNLKYISHLDVDPEYLKFLATTSASKLKISAYEMQLLGLIDPCQFDLLTGKFLEKSYLQRYKGIVFCRSDSPKDVAVTLDDDYLLGNGGRWPNGIIRIVSKNSPVLQTVAFDRGRSAEKSDMEKFIYGTDTNMTVYFRQLLRHKHLVQIPGVMVRYDHLKEQIPGFKIAYLEPTEGMSTNFPLFARQQPFTPAIQGLDWVDFSEHHQDVIVWNARSPNEFDPNHLYNFPVPEFCLATMALSGYYRYKKSFIKLDHSTKLSISRILPIKTHTVYNKDTTVRFCLDGSYECRYISLDYAQARRRCGDGPFPCKATTAFLPEMTNKPMKENVLHFYRSLYQYRQFWVYTRLFTGMMVSNNETMVPLAGGNHVFSKYYLKYLTNDGGYTPWFNNFTGATDQWVEGVPKNVEAAMMDARIMDNYSFKLTRSDFNYTQTCTGLAVDFVDSGIGSIRSSHLLIEHRTRNDSVIYLTNINRKG